MPVKKNVSTIPLSRRGKKRYVLFQLHVEGIPSPPKPAVEKELDAHFRACFGTLGITAHRIKIIIFDSLSGKGVIRCAHTSKSTVIAALVLFTKFQGSVATLRTLKTSGSLRSLRPYWEKE